MCKVQRYQKIVWDGNASYDRKYTYQDNIDNGVFSLDLSNANGIDIVNILTAYIYCI